MTSTCHLFHKRQRGATNLLIALVLSLSITLVTLAVAKTQLTEQRISANSHWHTRLALESRSRWSDAIANLTNNFNSLDWVPTAGDELINQATATTADNSIVSSVILLRAQSLSRYFDVQATASRNDNSLLSASYNQAVRTLTLLTPQAETLPPLILNGCLVSTSIQSAIRPINSDTDTAGAAAWLSGTQPCPPFSTFDLHAGQLNELTIQQSLWSTLFSVSIETFTALAEADLDLPAVERRYWLAGPENLVNGRWEQSLGSSTRPVALYFPADAGCPRFSDSIMIFGIVFIDTAGCPDPIADVRMEIFGALIVNGNLNTGTANLQLNHIQIADDSLVQLDFPVLRSVKVPGSWRDF